MAQKKLQGQTALVTGAAKRIGREIALALADEGVNIVLHHRSSASEADALRAELMERGVKAWTAKADFENPAEYQTSNPAGERGRGIAGYPGQQRLHIWPEHPSGCRS